MPLSPQPHRPNLTNGDQTVTKVDTRLTKVDTVNPSGASRTTLNTAERPLAASHPPPNLPPHRGEG